MVIDTNSSLRGNFNGDLKKEEKSLTSAVATELKDMHLIWQYKIKVKIGVYMFYSWIFIE
jgi:hypothetical protein